MQGTVVLVSVNPGDQVKAGQQVVVLESMKMEHIVAAPQAGRISSVSVTAGEAVRRDQPLLVITPGETDHAEDEVPEVVSDEIRADVAEVLNISASSTWPACRRVSNTGGGDHERRESLARQPCGSTRGMLPVRPPPVMWAMPLTSTFSSKV